MNRPQFAYATAKSGLSDANSIVDKTGHGAAASLARQEGSAPGTIAFVDYGGIPYAGICAHLMAQRLPALLIAPPVSLGRSNRRWMDRCATNLRLNRAGLPWRALLGRVPMDVEALCAADLLVAIDIRTEEALTASLPGRRPPIHQLTKWPAYRMPIHHQGLVEAMLADLESRIEGVIALLTRTAASS